MKKFYFLLLAFSLFTTANAQIINFTDAKFKAVLLGSKIAKGFFGYEYIKIDANNDGEIEVSEALLIRELFIESPSANTYGAPTFEISNLKELDNFTNLERLIITKLPLLTSIDISNLKKLKKCFIISTSITTLDTGFLPNLEEFTVAGNEELININLNGLPALDRLTCTYSNKLTSLEVIGLLNLTNIDCQNNNLNNLNISNCPKLSVLQCQNNRLTSLDLTGMYLLTMLYCYNNQITSLNFDDTPNLYYMDFKNNLFTSIDLSHLKYYFTINCSDNPLLNTLNFKNGWRNAEDKYLVFLNCPSLRYVCDDEIDSFSMQNIIKRYGYTNCHVNTYCSFTPNGEYFTIQGSQTLDSNANGCDSADFILSNLKFDIIGSTYRGSLFNASGSYSIPVQSGTHTITPVVENPSYFNVSPTTVNISFPTQTSPFTQNFCIAPNGVRPDLEATLLPLVPARPGFDAKYELVYKNKGNTIQSGVVNLTFNDTVLDLVVTNPVATNQTVNNLSWNFTNLQPFETREITFTMNVNSPQETPAVNNGTILNFTTTIASAATDENPIDNTFTFNQTVVGSYDPNDKTCLEGSVITPALIGQYVHYMIRFENKGTFAATNVVVKDMIDIAKFDISTLIPTSASHSYVTKISEGNKVEFIFENINLPFDDANNDGYIAFKIKTLPTLVVNDSFTNEANIYFDYNFPILTNKATSTFKTLGTQDFDFAHYFTLYPNPAKSDLNITTKETINVQSISVYNTLGQLVLVVTNANKVSKIDVSSLTSGNYFIQIKTDKGSSNARFVK